MDKLLLDALNNLSVSLENLTIALVQKSEAKSDVAGALSSGDISKKLDQILSILKSNPPKNNPDSRPAIVPMSKSIVSPSPGTFVRRSEMPIVKPPVSGIQESRESGPSFKEFSKKYLDKEQKREADVNAKSREVVREQTSISSPEEKKPLSIKDRISNIFFRKKEEPVKASDVNKPLTTPKSEVPSIKGPLSVILIGPKNVLDWFNKQQKLLNVSVPFKPITGRPESGISSPNPSTPPILRTPPIIPATPLTPVPSVKVSTKTDLKSNEGKIEKVQSELDSIVKQIDDIIDSKGPSFTNIIKVSKLAAQALAKEKELKKLRAEMGTVDSKVDSVSKSGIVPASLTPAPPIIPATPLTPVSSIPTTGIVPASLTPAPPIIPATPLTPVSSIPTTGIVPPNQGPLKVISQSPMTPVRGLTNDKTPRTVDNIKPTVATSVPASLTPAPPIIPATPLTPVSSIPNTGIVPPNQGPLKVISQSPIKPVRGLTNDKTPRTVDNIKPTVATSVPASPQAVKNPFVMGASYNTMPVIPVAVVAFGDGSTLLASSSQSRVLGKKPVPKDVKGSSKETKTTTAERMARPASEPDTDSRRRDRGVTRKEAPATRMTRPSTESVGRDRAGEKKPGFFDKGKAKSIKDGLALIVLMAAGILAIGLAFKVVGSVDFKSVIALALALPLVAFAFEKISRVKVTPKEMAMTSLALVMMSAAILASSFLISKVRPVGIAQAFATIVIAGTFAALASQLPKIFNSIRKVGMQTAIIGSFLLPVLLVAVSAAIMLSSNFIKNVKPIGLQQAFSTIVIGGMFAILASRIPNLITAVGKLSATGVIKAALFLPVVLVGVSAAIMLSSYFIARVKPIGLQQAFSTIMIAGAFAVISLSLGKLLRAFNGLNPLAAIMASILMPFVLVGVSYAIMKSSEYIRRVKPIGLQQAFSSIVIAGVFTLLGFGIGKLLRAFDKVNPIEAILFSFIAPLLLVAVSWAIMKSSRYISQVKPVGFLNFVSSLMISVVFIVLSFGIKKMVRAFDKVSIGDAIKASIFMPIVFVALSWSIMKSSPFISKTKPVGWLNFIAAIMISIIFIAMSFAAKFIIKNTRWVTASQMRKAGVILLAMAAATYAASHFIRLIPPISGAQMLSIVGLISTLVLMAGAAKLVVNLTKRVSKKELIKGGIVVLGVATTIMMSSLILSLGNYSGLPSAQWVLGASLTIGTFAALIFGAVKLNKMVSFTGMVKGAAVILIIASTIMASSLILSMGKYTLVPSKEWILDTTIGLAAFGTAIFIAAKLNKVIGLKEMAQGALVVLIVAATIMASSLILGLGKYDKYPTIEWSKGVGLSLLIFGTATAALGAAIVATAGLGALALAVGIGAVLGLAATIVGTAEILSKGDYGSYPTEDWIKGVSNSLKLFGTAVVTLGVISSGGGLVEGLTLGLVKNPIDAGKDAVKKISELIVETSSILSSGNYTTYPTADWISGVAKSLTLFGTAVVTLGAINSGGGLLEGLTLGAVKNPIQAGVDAIKAISQSIVDADNILASASYTNYPKLEWATGVGRAIGAFSEVYKLMMKSQITSFFFGGEAVTTDSFVKGITSISNAIKGAAETLGSTDFSGGPKEEWAKSVGIALGAFSEVYVMLQRQKFYDAWKSITGGGVSIDEFSTGIKTISEGIKTAATSLSDSEGIWKNGPGEEWAKGVSISIGAFSEVYSMLQQQKFFDAWKSLTGGGVTIEDFKNAIVTISNGIIESAKALANTDGIWKSGPGEDWAKGVAASIAGFAPVFTAVSESSGLAGTLAKKLGGGSSIDDYKNAISAIANGMIEAANILGEAKASFDKSKAPDVDWGKGVSSALTAFAPVFTYLSENSGWFTSGKEAAGDLQFAIGAVATAIKDSSVTLSTGIFTTEIKKEWIESVKTLFKDFIDLFSNSKLAKDKEDIAEAQNSIQVIASSIKNVSTTLSLGKYDIEFGGFEKGVKSLFSSFIEIFKKVKDAELQDATSGQVLSLSYTIKNVSNVLASGNLSAKINDNYPRLVSQLYDSFVKIFLKVKSAKIDSKSISNFESIAKSSARISLEISKGKYDVSVPKSYFQDLSSNVDKMLSIIKKLKNFKIVDFQKLTLVINQIKTSSEKISQIKFVKIPDKWSEQITVLINKFSELSSKISKIKFDSKNLTEISKSILATDKSLSAGKYNKYPDSKWVNNIKTVVLGFGKLISEVDKSFSIISIKKGVSKIQDILSSIVKVSNLISSGKYNLVPPPTWISRVRLVSLEMGRLANDIDKKFGLIGLKTGLNKVKSIAETIQSVSLSLMKGKYDIFPSADWAKGAFLSLQGFLSLKLPSMSFIDKLFGKTNVVDKKKLSDVMSLILMVDATFSKGKFRNFPSVAWANGTIESLGKFSTILSMFDFSKMDKKIGKGSGFSQMVTNIDMLARVFDKLSMSLERFTSTIGTIDTGKLESIRTLTSNVVLLSLMDPSQFDRMMQKLEENSGLFGSLLGDTGGKKSKASSPGKPNMPGEQKSDKITSVKTSTVGPIVNREAIELNRLMEDLIKLVGDMTSVVGAKGKLNEYIEEKMSAGKKSFNWQEFQGFDAANPG